MKNFDAIVFTGDLKIGNQGYMKYRKQSNETRLLNFIQSKYPDWKFIRMIDRVTQEEKYVKSNSNV
jgi:hypothetical protein